MDMEDTIMPDAPALEYNLYDTDGLSYHPPDRRRLFTASGPQAYPLSSRPSSGSGSDFGTGYGYGSASASASASASESDLGAGFPSGYGSGMDIDSGNAFGTGLNSGYGSGMEIDSGTHFGTGLNSGRGSLREPSFHPYLTEPRVDTGFHSLGPLFEPDFVPPFASRLQSANNPGAGFGRRAASSRSRSPFPLSADFPTPARTLTCRPLPDSMRIRNDSDRFFGWRRQTMNTRSSGSGSTSASNTGLLFPSSRQTTNTVSPGPIRTSGTISNRRFSFRKMTDPLFPGRRTSPRQPSDELPSGTDSGRRTSPRQTSNAVSSAASSGRGVSSRRKRNAASSASQNASDSVPGIARSENGTGNGIGNTTGNGSPAINYGTSSPRSPNVQATTYYERQARRRANASRRIKSRPIDPHYKELEEAREEIRTQQYAFDRAHLNKRSGSSIPFLTPKRSRSEHDQDTSSQRHVFERAPHLFDDDDGIPQPLIPVTPQRPARAFPVGGLDRAARPLLDATPPHLEGHNLPQPLVAAPAQQQPAVNDAPEPFQLPQWPLELYHRATWHAAVPPWRRIRVPVSRIAQLARIAQRGIQVAIQTGITVVSLLAQLFSDLAARDETHAPAEAQVAAPAPVPPNDPPAAPVPAEAPAEVPVQPANEPAAQGAAELDERALDQAMHLDSEPWRNEADPMSFQLQAELTAHADHISQSPPLLRPVESHRVSAHLERTANYLSEEDITVEMSATAREEAREPLERTTAEAEDNTPAVRTSDEDVPPAARTVDENDSERNAQPRFALIPPLVPWLRSTVPFDPTVPQVAPRSPLLSAPDSPEVIQNPRPVVEAPGFDLAAPPRGADESVAPVLAPAQRPFNEIPAIRLTAAPAIPTDSSEMSQPAVEAAPAQGVAEPPAAHDTLGQGASPHAVDAATGGSPALAPSRPSLAESSSRVADAFPTLGSAPLLRPSTVPPALGLSPHRPAPPSPAPLPEAPVIDVTTPLRLRPSAPQSFDTPTTPTPMAPTSNPTTVDSPILSSSPNVAVTPATPAARPSSLANSPGVPQTSRQYPVTPIRRLIPDLSRRYRPTPALRRTTARLPSTSEDVDVEETRTLLSTTTISGRAGVTPTRLQWWEADSPLGRPISTVQLFGVNDPPAIISDRTAPVYRDEFEEMQREVRMRRIRERTLALSRQRVPDGETPVRPLSSAMERVVESAMSAAGNRVLGSTLDGADLTKQKLLTCYQDMAWLNDEIINGHLALTVEYLRRKAGNTSRDSRPKYHAFNSFFYSKLRDGGYKDVARWARRAKIGGEQLLDVETVFVPVHQHSHWTLLVVSPVNKTIEYFDSLGGRCWPFVDTIKEWLQGELGEKYEEDEWTVLRTPSPRQDNGSDCGVFLLTTAKAVALGLEPTVYGPAQIPLLRKKIVAELLNGGFRGDLDPSGPGSTRL